MNLIENSHGKKWRREQRGPKFEIDRTDGLDLRCIVKIQVINLLNHFFLV